MLELRCKKAAQASRSCTETVPLAAGGRRAVKNPQKATGRCTTVAAPGIPACMHVGIQMSGHAEDGCQSKRDDEEQKVYMTEPLMTNAAALRGSNASMTLLSCWTATCRACVVAACDRTAQSTRYATSCTTCAAAESLLQAELSGPGALSLQLQKPARTTSSRSKRAAPARQVSTMAASSAALLMGGTQTATKRLASAGDSSRLPKSPPGFMVAASLKPGAGVTLSSVCPPFSARTKLPPGSSTLHRYGCG